MSAAQRSRNLCLCCRHGLTLFGFARTMLGLRRATDGGNHRVEATSSGTGGLAARQKLPGDLFWISAELGKTVAAKVNLSIARIFVEQFGEEFCKPRI